MEKLQFTSIRQAKRITGLDYIGKVNNGTKHEKAFKYKELVYTIYLAPGNMSGYEVCPARTPECSKVCLNGSGRNILDKNIGNINRSRIKKTKLLYENREFFTKWVISEIKQGYNRAKKLGYTFSVRINNTSDISPEHLFIIENNERKNIFQLFPDVQFYDYTKVTQRYQLLNKYDNYDLTFSYNGSNWETCEILLKQNKRVAVVFEKVPTSYKGFEVIDGDKYDMRYKDPKGVIIGLKYKRTYNQLDENNHFVIREKELVSNTCEVL